MRTQIYFSSLLTVQLALHLTGCFNNNRSSSAQQLEIGTRSNAAGSELAVNSSSAAASGSDSEKSGTATSLDSSTATSKDPLDFIGSWDGTRDDIPPEYNWKVTNVQLEGNPTSGSTTPPSTAPGTTSSSNPSSGEVSGNTVTFTIQAGTRNSGRSWNDQANPVRVRVGGSLTIINADAVPHTLHTNNVPFPHGDAIPPGGRATYTIASPFYGSPEELYEHDDSGGNRYMGIKFYLRTE